MLNHCQLVIPNHEWSISPHNITMPLVYQPSRFIVTHTKLVTPISWIISHNYHVPVTSKLITQNSYTTPFIHAIQFINLKVKLIQACCSLLKIQETSRPTHSSPSTSLRQKGLAQARRTLAQASSLRLGESSTSSMRTLRAFSLRREPPRLSETFARPKRTVGRLGDPSRRNT